MPDSENLCISQRLLITSFASDLKLK